MIATSSGSNRSAEIDSEERALRICLTPTRNESWIIRPFLAAAESWADHVIVADQQSSDGTADEIRRHARATLIHNDSPSYEENHRQKLLLSHARHLHGKRILIGLDADEALSANSATSSEWSAIESAPPGTVLRFRWVNVLPGFQTAWICPGHVALGYVDDGTEHSGKKIHSPRVPHPEGAPVLDLKEIVVLHFQYILWERMRSKQRWYQAWEHSSHKQKRPLEIFRQYNHMNGSWNAHEVVPIQPSWLEGYDRSGIDFRSLKCEPVTWWDREVVTMLTQDGPSAFSKIAIWDQDWNAVAKRIGINNPQFHDPRSGIERMAHRLLAATQSTREKITVRALERILRTFGW